MPAFLRPLVCLTAFFVLLVSAPQSATANPQPGLGPPPQDISRVTPRRSLEYFLEATRDADFDRAAYILDLRSVPRTRQEERGAVAARKLRTVLDRKLRIELLEVSDEPEGNPNDGRRTDTIGTIALADQEIPIRLARVSNGGDAQIWVFSGATVGAIDELYDAYGPGLIAEQLPELYLKRSLLDIAWWQWIGLVVALVIAIVVGFFVATVLRFIGKRLVRQTKTKIDDPIVSRIRGPLWAFITLSIWKTGLDLLQLPIAAQTVTHRVLATSFIFATAWGLMRLVQAIAEIALERMVERSSEGDAELIRHGQRRQVETARTFINGLILFLASAVALTQFEVVREVGVSLLASAGVLGVILGIAAQKSVANLIAGIQISAAQPIRIGDRVRISGDVGWIEEITLTYVTMKTWDNRRRIFPITYFIENEFENWTLTSTQLIGDVILHVDYRTPIDRVRERLLRFVEEDPDWDGQVANVVVREATAETVVLRVLASSADPGRNWDLRCRVREKALGFLQQLDEGRYLPRRRFVLESDGGFAQPDVMAEARRVGDDG